MLLPKEDRVRDDAYRKSAQDRSCEGCGGYHCSRDTVVGAHPRIAGSGGMALKAGDDLLIFLGRHCHDEFDGRIKAGSSAQWLVRHFLFLRLGIPSPSTDELEGDHDAEIICFWIVKHVIFPMLRNRYREWKAGR